VDPASATFYGVDLNFCEKAGHGFCVNGMVHIECVKSMAEMGTEPKPDWKCKFGGYSSSES